MHNVFSASSAVKDKITKCNAKGINYSFGFKVFTNYTFGLCTLFAILVISADYLGSHIDCYHFSDNNITKESFQAYCWVHGGSRLRKNIDKIGNETTQDNMDQVKYCD